MRTIIIIPAYNEADSIVNTISNIQNLDASYDYVIINDGSTDKTLDICLDKGYNVVTLPNNLGIGGAVQTGYMYAKEHNYDIAVQIDADGQHNPQYLPNLLQPIIENKADMTIGSRFITKEGFQSSIARRLGIKLLSSLIKFKTNQKIYDVTSGFRAVNASIIDNFSKHYPTDYPEPETITSTILSGKKVLEVPTTMNERTAGKSSIRPLHSVYYIVKVSLAILMCHKQ